MIATLRALLFTGLVFLMASPVYADRITAGALTYTSGGGPLSVTLASASFTFDGRASAFSGIFMPWLQCSVPECVPGGSVDLLALWSGMDLPGTASLDGETYPHVGGLVSPSSLFATWTGTLAIPPGFESGVLIAPFAFSGQFFYERMTGETGVLDLFGGGIATASFRPQPAFPGALALDSIRYEFAAEAAPTPEPASLALLGTGLAGLLAARRLRRTG